MGVDRIDKTEIEWTYEPADLFEAPYVHTTAEFDLRLEAGRAMATVSAPQRPLEEALERGIHATLQSVLRSRQLVDRRKYSLEGPRVYQHQDGKRHITFRVGCGEMKVTGGVVDFVQLDPVGTIVRDSKAERIATDIDVLNVFANKASHPVLRRVLESYSRSVSDPANELVHMYEVREALAAHFGTELGARVALNISQAEWTRVGLLSNVEPLEEGRHRGRHANGLRPATGAELEEVRRIIRRWIKDLAKAL